MESWAQKRVLELESEHLDGFIFKRNSPSCGMERVKVYGPKGRVRRNGVGIFARALMVHFPLFPVAEEGSLHDVDVRENFIERVRAFAHCCKTGR